MTKVTAGGPPTKRPAAAQSLEPRPAPAKKDAGGKVSSAAKTFPVKSPRNRG